ncbi:hydroxymethylglutaryl-CoA lyase [Aestuariivirga sp.]|uniref:hydroxymethylglutaryl-CoA lyase n=1 Tax=Aestuariivirga sp. TaxID=2650926 RepID=UPI00391AB95F
MAERVTICEVSPRDGLQNEKVRVSTADKIRLIGMLTDCGLTYIEAASFVSPSAVPAMADGAEVMAGIRRMAGVTYAALTPNMRGYAAARDAKADEVAVFAAASETFSCHNVNASIAESLARYREICRAAKADGLPVRGYVSCIAICPYEGEIAAERVEEVSLALLEMGCREVSLGDTVGRATPEQIERLLDRLGRCIPPSLLAGHFHDTAGRALACVEVALAHGLRVFDASAGGTGGCPFAPGAKGNIATEALAAMLAAEGFETGLDMAALEKACDFLRRVLGRNA